MPPPSIAGMIAAGVLRKLPWGGEPETASRTTHGFTFSERLMQLNSLCDPMRERLQAGVAPALNLFNGTASDPSKVFALKKVATELAEQRALPFSEAVAVYFDTRASFMVHRRQVGVAAFRGQRGVLDRPLRRQHAIHDRQPLRVCPHGHHHPVACPNQPVDNHPWETILEAGVAEARRSSRNRTFRGLHSCKP